MSTLVIAEHHQGQLQSITLNAITAAKLLSQNITVLIAGLNCEEVVNAVKMLDGVNEILVADHPCYEHCLAESLAPLIVSLVQEKFNTVIAAASTFSKNYLPRVAALLDVAQISDVQAIIDENTFLRPIYAGNIITKVKTQDKIKVLTIRPTAFEATSQTTTAATIQHIDTVIENNQSSWVSETHQASDRPALTDADIVISGGRGLGNQQMFERLEKIAECLNAAVGASRAAVDAGFVANEYQVGQTGQTVAPKLYIALGISGAIQHLAGMKDSKVIVAINKDPEAPVFSIADYGLVADVNEVFDQWESLLSIKS